MSKRDDLIETHDLTVKGFADQSFVHLQAGNIEEALHALEHGVSACETHPAYAKFAKSHCKVVEMMLAGCAQIASSRDNLEAAARAVALLRRMQVLNSSELH